MAENSKIEWTTHMFNPWRGCTKVAEGCKFCYADTLSKRNPGTLGIWGPDGTRVVASEAMWRDPVKWNREAACIQSFDCNGGSHSDACPQASRPRVFCASLADVFEDWNGECLDSSGCAHYTHDDDPRNMVRSRQMFGCDTESYHYTTLSDVRRRLFALIDATPNLDWLLLTKRPENIPRMWLPTDGTKECEATSVRHNVWLGTSVATQDDANKNLDELDRCRDLAPVRFVSAEPLLENVNLRLANHAVNWLIVGGESGPNARPMHPDWVRSLRDQCQAAGVPFLFKQWGEWLPMGQQERSKKYPNIVADGANGCPEGGWPESQVHRWGGIYESYRAGKKAAGRTLDGWEWDEYPKTTVDENNVSR